MKSRYMLSIMLEPKSLLILSDDMYTKFLHGISEKSEDIITDKICNLQQLGTLTSHGTVLQRSTRISLTIRNVPKTLRLHVRVRK